MPNVTSEVSSPIPLIALTAPRGTKARITATAIGSQMLQLSTCVICSQFAVRGSQLTTANCSAAYRDLRTSSYKYPYEDDHSQKKHQRVIAHIAGLEEAQQIADCGHDVTDHRQQSVDESV